MENNRDQKFITPPSPLGDCPGLGISRNERYLAALENREEEYTLPQKEETARKAKITSNPNGIFYLPKKIGDMTFEEKESCLREVKARLEEIQTNDESQKIESNEADPFDDFDFNGDDEALRNDRPSF